MEFRQLVDQVFQLFNHIGSLQNLESLLVVFSFSVVVINWKGLVVQIVVLVVVIEACCVVKHKSLNLARRVVLMGTLSLGLALIRGNSCQAFNVSLGFP